MFFRSIIPIVPFGDEKLSTQGSKYKTIQFLVT